MNGKFSAIYSLVTVLATGSALFSQPASAVEFYDPTGVIVTSKFGWKGGAADGYFFIETPDDGDGFKLQKGSLTLGGIITAIKFVGDGSGLTGLNLPAELDPTVPAGLKDGISWNEIQDIPAGFADGIDNVATFATGSAGEDPSAQEVAAVLLNDAAFLAQVKGKDGITQDLTEYALKTDIPDMPDMTNYALKTDIPDLSDMSGYAKKTEIPNMNDYALKTDIPQLPDLTVLKDGISWTEIQGIPAGFADGIDNVATGGTGNPSETASAQEVAAVLMNNATFLAQVKGDKGEQGDKGEPGAPGLPGTNGTSPSVDGVAAALKQDAVFLAQVKGEKGDKGAKGDPGAPGLPGTNGVSPSVDGVAAALKQDAVFLAQVKGEKGDKGAKGDPGAPGLPGTDGSSPSVGDVATALKQDAVFLAQVKGDKGEPGEQGDKGDKGDKGDPGSTRWTDIIDKPDMSKYLDFTSFQGFKRIENPILFTSNNSDVGLYSQMNASSSTYSRAGLFQLMQSGYEKASATLAFKNGATNYAGWFSGDVFISGNLTTTSCIGCSSDKRFKKNVVKIESAMEKIKQLQGVSFEWKREQYPEKKFNKGRQLGVIAQETQKVLPEAVSEHEGHLYVSYDQITPVLIEALKEQQATIRKLQGKLNLVHSDLKNQKIINQALNDRLSKVEKIITNNASIRNTNIAKNIY